jgi:hypothetical protein
MLRNKHSILPTRAAALAALMIAVGIGTVALAKVDDARAAALEISAAGVKQGFKLREEYWSGQMKSAEQKAVKSQLFKGNEYWFWLGCGQEGAEITLEIFDTKGAKVHVETVSSAKGSAVRVIPPKTGTYVVMFKINLKKDPPPTVDWALSYGYR